MYDGIILTQPGEWVGWAYFLLSTILLVVFLKIKSKQQVLPSLIKVVSFILILILAVAQFFAFRFGLSGIYDFFGYFPQDSLYIRYAALFFCCGYAFSLPVRNIQHQ